MDKDRFKRRGDYSSPVRRPVSPPPVVDGIDQARPQSLQPAPQQAPAQPKSAAQLAPQAPVATTQPAPAPVWAEPRQLPAAEASATPVVPSTSTTINVNLSLPKFSKPKVKLPRPSKKVVKLTILVLVVLLLVVGAAFAAKHFLIRPKPVVAFGSGQSTSLKAPTFKPVAPNQKQELSTSKAAGTSFDGSKNTYSYSDRLEGMTIVVSQQPLPTTFPTAQAAVDKIASSISAKTPLKLANGSTAYVATDTKSNSQILVFSTNSLLIFIQSPFIHNAAIWQNYIATLK